GRVEMDAPTGLESQSVGAWIGAVEGLDRVSRAERTGCVLNVRALADAALTLVQDRRSDQYVDATDVHVTGDLEVAAGVPGEHVVTRHAGERCARWEVEHAVGQLAADVRARRQVESVGHVVREGRIELRERDVERVVRAEHPGAFRVLE